MADVPVLEPLWTGVEVAAYLRVSKSSLGALRADGMPYIRLSRATYRYKPSSIQAWVDRREEREQPSPDGYSPAVAKAVADFQRRRDSFPTRPRGMPNKDWMRATAHLRPPVSLLE